MSRSSLIQRAIYDRAEQTLAVTFTTGRSYLYFGISVELYSEFASAPSQGQFFNWRIRDQYESSWIKADTRCQVWRATPSAAC